jgi:hypothetical protein
MRKKSEKARILAEKREKSIASRRVRRYIASARPHPDRQPEKENKSTHGIRPNDEVAAHQSHR